MKGKNNSVSRPRGISITKPLAFVDLETRGSIIGLDRVVEVGVLKILPDGDELSFERRVNPEMGITPEATAMHGIKDSDVQDAPVFGVVAAQLSDFLDASDLGGYNLVSFDIPMLQAEFQRVGRTLAIQGRRIIDVMDIYVQKEPRDLRSAYRFYCGRELQKAHLASSDARACWQVLQGQMRMYADLPNTPDGLSNYVAQYRRKRTLDSGGWFIARYGKPALARGKYQGMLIREVEEVDPHYLDWMLSIGQPEDTIQVIKSVLPGFGT
jgi:DNA polymerase III subunit epsilon